MACFSMDDRKQIIPNIKSEIVWEMSEKKKIIISRIL